MSFKGPADALGWAKKPRSQFALDEVFKIAARDKRFAMIRDKLVERGIAGDDGKLRHHFDGTQWHAGNGVPPTA